VTRAPGHAAPRLRVTPSTHTLETFRVELVDRDLTRLNDEPVTRAGVDIGGNA
jgi:hypothetical protein